MAVPTEQDIKGAQLRAEIAEKENRDYYQAVESCGPGANRYACWVIRDKTGRLPEQRIFCCQRDGITGWQPGHETSDERLTEADHPGFEINGEKLFPFRFSYGLHTVNLYQPHTAEQLAEAREKRVAKKREKLRKAILEKQKVALSPEVYEPELHDIETMTG